ncbi:hypothetical protein QTH97_29635 [Variovorax sp. J22R24]|uniref:hypothetical protein n=1 Tax=Variovorax gracilis TaxID=3053502 RepID=UPI002577D4A7|nr:hypothetical protein [Variovorax sp. J22R24]MDM0109135.1 hypothetical protein [Variovorax sp. J22R24]
MTTLGKEEGSEGAPKQEWTWHVITGVAGLFLLVAYAGYRLLHHTEADVLMEAAAEFVLRDLGIALVIAVVVASLFDKAYHQKMVNEPLVALEKSVHKTTTELLEMTRIAEMAVQGTVSHMQEELAHRIEDVQRRDASLKNQYEEMVAGFSLLSRSGALGVVALHERSKDFKDVLCTALRSAVQHCWIVGRTHKEMLGAEDEGKGWLVQDLEAKLRTRQDFTLKILLANPFDPILEASQTDIEKDRTVPRARNPAREPLHGIQEARKAIYQVLALLAPHSTERRVEVKLLRTFAVPYCMLMTEQRMFVEHYLPSREGGALSITEIEAKDRPREQAPYDCFKSDFRKLFDYGENCDVVLERFRDRKIDQYSDEPTGQSVERDYPELTRAIDNARRLSNMPDLAPAEGVRRPSDFRCNRVHADQQSVYAEVIRYIKGHDVRRAILVQYSAVKVEDVLIELMAKGADIDLYVQSPEIAQTEMKMQSVRIAVQQNHLPKVLLRHNNHGTCRIFEYLPRATLRGILIEDHLLAIGPYIYQTSMRHDPSYPNDKIEIKGHDSPGMLFWYGTHEYRVFCDAYLDLVENFSGDGLTPVLTIADDMVPPQGRSHGEAGGTEAAT